MFPACIAAGSFIIAAMGFAAPPALGVHRKTHSFAPWKMTIARVVSFWKAPFLRYFFGFFFGIAIFLAFQNEQQHTSLVGHERCFAKVFLTTNNSSDVGWPYDVKKEHRECVEQSGLDKMVPSINVHITTFARGFIRQLPCICEFVATKRLQHRHLPFLSGFFQHGTSSERSGPSICREGAEEPLQSTRNTVLRVWCFFGF